MTIVNVVCRVLMDSFTPEQYERFEAYRRHALPKQAVRKVCAVFLAFIYDIIQCMTPCLACAQVIQQTLGQQVSMPVAQVVAGFSKVFVGEIVEKGT